MSSVDLWVPSVWRVMWGLKLQTVDMGVYVFPRSMTVYSGDVIVRYDSGRFQVFGYFK